MPVPTEHGLAARARVRACVCPPLKKFLLSDLLESPPRPRRAPEASTERLRPLGRPALRAGAEPRAHPTTSRAAARALDDVTSGRCYRRAGDGHRGRAREDERDRPRDERGTLRAPFSGLIPPSDGRGGSRGVRRGPARLQVPTGLPAARGRVEASGPRTRRSRRSGWGGGVHG